MGLKAEIPANYRTSKGAGKGQLMFEEVEEGFIEVSLRMSRTTIKPVCKVSGNDLARVGAFYGLHKNE